MFGCCTIQTLVKICFSAFCIQKGWNEEEKAKKLRQTLAKECFFDFFLGIKPLTSLWVNPQKAHFCWILPQFSLFFLLFSDFCKKMKKSIFLQAFGVCSTQSLVKIYNERISFNSKQIHTNSCVILMFLNFVCMASHKLPSCISYLQSMIIFGEIGSPTGASNVPKKL